MSLVSLLSIARSALLTHQAAINVTSHNIANAQTPGYSRQMLDLIQHDPYRTVDGTMGRGVTDAGVLRSRNGFLDASFRREAGLLSGHTTLFEFLSRVEAATNEPSDQGLAAALDGFFGAFSDLASDPSSPVSREEVRSAGARVAARLQAVAGAVGQATQDAFSRMQQEVGQVNDLTRRIAELNAEILAAGGPMQQAADLQDQRDRLIDQLSTLVGARAIERPDGTVAVIAGNTVLVDAAESRVLEVRSLVTGGFGLGLVNGGPPADVGGGSLRALETLTTTTLPGIRAELDALAQSLVNEVNALHQGGVTRTGATGANFFDPAGVTAATIALDPGVLASTDAIAAGATAAPGDADVALALSELGRAAIPGLGGATFRVVYANTASRLGQLVRNSMDDADASQVLVDRADAARQSVSGVSIDEEMVVLLQQQQAYQAAARLISLANEMMDDVLRMI